MLEKLNAQSTPVKIVIALVIAALVGGGVWYFLVNPMNEANVQAKAALDAQIKENTELKQYETKLGDLDRQIVQLKAQMEYQKQIVPDEKEADNFIILLQEQASNTGINLRKIEAKPPSNKEFYTEVPFGIQIDGPFYGVMSYFEKLAGQTRIVNVSDMQMKTTAKQSQFPLGPNDSVSVTATAKTFFSKEAAAAPAPASTTPAKK